MRICKRCKEVDKTPLYQTSNSKLCISLDCQKCRLLDRDMRVMIKKHRRKEFLKKWNLYYFKRGVLL